MCVQNDQCDEGLVLRSLCWGTRDPSPPPRTPPPFRGFRGCRCWGLHLGAPRGRRLQSFAVGCTFHCHRQNGIQPPPPPAPPTHGLDQRTQVTGNTSPSTRPHCTAPDPKKGVGRRTRRATVRIAVPDSGLCFVCGLRDRGRGWGVWVGGQRKVCGPEMGVSFLALDQKFHFSPEQLSLDSGGGVMWPGGVAPATTSTSSIRQLLGAADTQTAHHATFSTAPAHQLLGSANAETTPAGAPAAAADRTQRPDATCEGKNG